MEHSSEVMYVIIDMNDFLREADANKYIVDFPYGSSSKARPGDTKNEPGRNAAPHAANATNRKVIQTFVTKHSLDYTADPEKVFLPSLKRALIEYFGKDAFDKAESNHRQKWRLVDDIGSFINQTLTWGASLSIIEQIL